jgi:hypothetical protein
MEIKLNRDTFVDRRTGEESAPSEFLENLRGLEEMISRADDDIASLKGDLRTAREARETLVVRLRACVREGKVLPLFETPIAVAPEVDDEEPPA